MPIAPWSSTAALRLWLPLLTCLLALGGGACANRGMEAPGQIEEDGGFGTGGTRGTGGISGAGTGGSAGTGGGGGLLGSGGRGGSGGATGGVGGKGGSAGAGGTTAAGGVTGTGGIPATGGVTGTGGLPATGGVTGTGGVPATGGITGTGGIPATGGVPGTGGVPATGGITGTGGIPATGGVTGTGGIPATGGVTGTGGIPATGGITGTGGIPATGGVPGTGGVPATGGTGGAAGAGANVCARGGVLDCSSAGALTLTPDGQVADFSPAVWNSSTGKWCDADGLSGSVFAYAGTASTSTAAVDTTAQNLKLNFKVAAADYAGGGLTFDSCVNATGFTSVQFNATVTAGSLTGCVWQVQLQTQDQRASTATSPSGGTCASNCYRFPTVATLATPAAAGTTYTEALTAFSNPSGSTIATRTQVVGLQWQVNSSSAGAGTCTVELRIDNIKFQ